MNHTRSITVAEIRSFLTSAEALAFTVTRQGDAYSWLETTLRELDYLHLRKPDKGLVRQYVRKMTGYSRTQITTLIHRFRTTSYVRGKPPRRHRFPRKYGPADGALLAKVDLAHGQLSGPATKHILEREYQIFHKPEYERLAQISPAHIYHLRATQPYRDQTKLFTKTRSTKSQIGERRKPEPGGQPGFIRVDSVHQGDDPVTGKSVYHVNFVDEVTQWELVACVEQITERFLEPVFIEIIGQFPFVIQNFHSDNGSEFINQVVAKLLEKLRIRQTKSRPRHSTDNGLVETKNGVVIRKHMGYHHIPKRQARWIHKWYRTWFNVYLNYHRPCAFGKEVMTNERTGKRKRIYPPGDYVTPYEKLRSLPNAASYLKPTVTFAKLDQLAYAQSDTDFVAQMNTAKQRLAMSFT